ncbi:MAG: methyltransferase family protein [Sulfobacillus sp.]
MGTQTRDRPGVIAPPPLIYVGAIVLGAILERLLPVRPAVLTTMASRGFGTALVIASGLLSIWGLRVMQQAGTQVDPNKPTSAIVKSGPFRFSRNPLYLALTIFQLGIGFVFGWPWVWVTLMFTLWLMKYGVIDREERYLEKKFGQEYIDYKSRVRRWI